MRGIKIFWVCVLCILALPNVFNRIETSGKNVLLPLYIYIYITTYIKQNLLTTIRQDPHELNAEGCD